MPVPDHLTDEGQRRIADGTDPIPDLPEYEVLRGFADYTRSTCRDCGTVCVDTGWQGEPHWAHAVSGRGYMHGAIPTTITPGAQPQPSRRPLDEDEDCGDCRYPKDSCPRSGACKWGNADEPADEFIEFMREMFRYEMAGAMLVPMSEVDGRSWVSDHDEAHDPVLWGDGYGGCGHDDCKPAPPPDGSVYMLGANLCPACGKAYGNHVRPVTYPDLVCHEPERMFRLADSVAMRREDLEDEPNLRSILSAEMARPGALDGYNAAIRSEQVTHWRGSEDLREAIQRAMTARYEPTGLILHPVEHASVSINPDDPESIETAKRIADSFDVPYWLMGIPGYDPPLRIRVRRWLRALPRRLSRHVPGVLYYGRRETGEGWMNDQPAGPRAWRWGVHVGNYRIGTEPHDPWTCGDPECTEAHP